MHVRRYYIELVVDGVQRSPLEAIVEGVNSSKKRLIDGVPS